LQTTVRTSGGDGFYEFQKEHRTVQELKKQVAELTADLQKVNAQLELSKSEQGNWAKRLIFAGPRGSFGAC
jgi:hypothetical protein